MQLRMTYESQSEFWYPIQCFVKAVLLLPRSFRLISVHWQGIEKRSGRPVKATYFGEGESLQYLQSLIFEQVVAEERTFLYIFRLAKAIRTAHATDSIVMVELDRFFKWVMPRGGKIIYPWIRQRADLQQSLYQASRSRVHATYGRLVRKYHYQVHETRSRSAIEQFYHTLYKDYVRYRHPHFVHARSLDEFLHYGSRSLLLQIYRGGEWVSGALCRLGNDSITAMAFGVALPYDSHLKRGALSAAYYFLFRLAEEKNLRFVDLLRSRANRYDGVYEHKRRWGADVLRDRWCHTVIGIYTGGPCEQESFLSGMLFFPE